MKETASIFGYAGEGKVKVKGKGKGKVVPCLIN
jgi:hypothetical protein